MTSTFERRSVGSTFTAIALLGSWLAVPGIGRADDASFYGDGATVYAIKESRIRMQKETVVIRHDEAESSRDWIADCTFAFVNQSNQAIDLQMGFPDWRTATGPESWTIQHFAVKVDGQAVETEHKEVVVEGDEGSAAIPPGGGAEYQGAYTWRVHFQPRGTVLVHNTFAFGGLSTMGPLSHMYSKPGFPLPWLYWRSRGSNEPIGGCDFDDSVFKQVQYIVTTAHTWAGPIGEADITIQIPPRTLPHQLVVTPVATSVGGGAVHWHRKHWSPTHEVAMFSLIPTGDACLRPPLFDSEVQARAWMVAAKAHGIKRDAVELVRDAYLARRGKPIAHPGRRAYFADLIEVWPPIGDGSAPLPPSEVKIMALLDRFARSLPVAKPFVVKPPR